MDPNAKKHMKAAAGEAPEAGVVDPMDRLAIVESQLAEARSALAKRDAEIAKRDAELAKVAARLEAVEAREQERVAAARAAYLDEIQARATELGHPIAADDLAKVERRFEAGDDETARELGDAFVELAQARAGAASPGPRRAGLRPLQTQESDEDARARGLALYEEAEEKAGGRKRRVAWNR